MTLGLLPGPVLSRPNRYGARGITMLAPRCDICCPNTKRAPRGWLQRCKHDPYVGDRVVIETSRTYEDEIGPDGKPTGRRLIGGTEEKHVLEPWPNLVEVLLSNRVNSGMGVEKAKRKGFIMPQELRSPAWPEGLEPFCQSLDCRVQEGLKSYVSGDFHLEEEAMEVYADQRGITRWLGGTGDTPEIRAKGDDAKMEQDDMLRSRVKVRA